MNTTVPFGWASRVGYLLTLLGAAATAWASASSNPAISPETLLIVTIAAGVLTNLGRQLQAPKAEPGVETETPPPVPKDVEESAPPA